MAVADFKINGTLQSTLGFDGSNAQVLTLELENVPAIDAARVVYSEVTKSKDAPALSFSPSDGKPTTPTGQVTVTLPASGAHTFNLQCQVNEGIDATGKVNADYTKQRIVCIRTANGAIRKWVPGESTQYSARGWTDEQNIEADAVSAALGSLLSPWKGAARAVATTNQSLSGTPTIDGVSLGAGDVVLLTGQTAPAENGPWTVAVGAWARAGDADSSLEVTPGLTLKVTAGTSHADSFWTLITDGAIVLGTTALTFEKRFGTATQVTAPVTNSGTAFEPNIGITLGTTPSTIAVGDAASGGAAVSVARTDHVHALPAPAAPADVTKAAASAGVATTVARADHKHDVSTATAGSILVGDAAAEGSSTALARADHVHAMAAPAAPADVTKAAASAGAATAAARADHKHDVSTAAPAAGAVAVGNAASEGSATSLARSDHVHAVSSAAPVDVATSNTEGVATTFSRSDHAHALLAKWRSQTAGWQKDAIDSLASSTTAETPFERVPDARTVLTVHYVPDAVLVSNDTDYATLTVYRRSSSGGSQTTVATVRTQTSGSGGSGDWVAFRPVDFGSISAAALSAGQVLTVEIGKTGNGVRVPAGRLVVATSID